MLKTSTTAIRVDSRSATGGSISWCAIRGITAW